MGIDDRRQALDLLRRALEVEYTPIVHYPRLAREVRQEELRHMVTTLGAASIRHADTVAEAIRGLGEEPPLPDIAPLPEPLDLVAIFQRQLEYEKLALLLHTRAAELISNTLGEEMGHRLREIADQAR